MKKFIVLILLATLAAGVVFGDPNKPYAGTKLVVACLDTTNYRKMDNLLPLLEQRTGIQVTIDYIPENAYMAKLQVVLSSKTGEYDFFYANNKMYPVLFPSGWIQPQAEEPPPRPASRTTDGEPLPEICMCSRHPSMSSRVPGAVSSRWSRAEAMFWYK